ncbi:OmpA family protein [Lewinella sp. LCG006]|uniref:OmpA family protein n=1 Tax=Lewinella sp. LCG006 TaxID=3231911 RepID=UPI00345FD7CF
MRLLTLVFFLLSLRLTAQLPGVFDSLQLNFSDTLYFDSGKANLDEVAQQTLSNFPAMGKVNDLIYLTGHTDAIGSLEYNEALAKKRADEARKVLLAKGWPEEALVIKTFGERTPIASNDTDLDRSRNRRVTIDLYRAIPYRQFLGQVNNPNDQQPIPNAKVRLHNRTLADTLVTDNEGRFTVDLPIDSVVGIDVYAKGFFLDTKMIKISPTTKQDLNFELAPATEGEVATIKNLFYVGNEAILLPGSQPELPKILRFMQINTHLKVEIAGHVNYPNRPPVTQETPEWDLSVRRAKMVYDYLIENNIPSEQLSYKGYGNHEMVYPKATSEIEQAANRRVEIRILEVLPEKK